MKQKVVKKENSKILIAIKAIVNVIESVCDIARELNKFARLHGISHIVNKRLHPIERFLWFLFVSASFYFIFRIGYSQIIRYKANPTVISIERGAKMSLS
jgi:Amiloride-sensitive sodium channel